MKLRPAEVHRLAEIRKWHAEQMAVRMQVEASPWWGTLQALLKRWSPDADVHRASDYIEVIGWLLRLIDRERDRSGDVQ